MLKKHYRKLVLTISALMLTTTTTFAYTDDTSIIGGLDRDTDAYSYLNMYNYHLYRTNDKYLYGSVDNQVIIRISDRGNITDIFILGGDYATNKGVKVGDTVQDIINAYGPAYDSTNPQNWHKSEEANTGEIIKYDSPWAQKKGISGYIEFEYKDYRNSGLSFIVNKYTQKVVLIRYNSDRHGSSQGVPAASYYCLIPWLE